MKCFCIIKEKTAYMKCVIQSSMFYSFYLSLSILLCNIDSALVSDWNADYFNFELYSNVRIIFKCSKLYSNVEGMCFQYILLKNGSSDDVGKKFHSFTKSQQPMLVRKNFVFYLEGGGGGVCTKRHVTQKSSREQT